MDSLAEKQKSVRNQSTRFPVAFSFILRFVLLLGGAKFLSDEELANAGIDLGHQQDE
jgi:hypothetical protein